MYIYGCFLLCYLVNGKLTEWIGALMALLRARRISISIGYCTELGGHQRQGEVLKLLQTSPLKFTQNFELNLDLADWAPAETCRTAPPIRAPLPIRWSLRIRTSCLCAMSVSSPENSSWTRALLLIRTPSACRQIQTPKWPSSGLDLRYPSAHLHICTSAQGIQQHIISYWFLHCLRIWILWKPILGAITSFYPVGSFM